MKVNENCIDSNIHKLMMTKIIGMTVLRVSSFILIAVLVASNSYAWKAIAKDGADLPAIQATVKPARQVISVGETYDFEYSPTSIGDLRLEVLKPKGFLPEFRMETAVRVR